MNRQLHGLGSLAVALVWYLCAGCATDPAKSVHTFPPPPSEEVRAELGAICVESAGAETKPHFDKPDSRGKSAAKGALGGMLAVGEVSQHGSASGWLAGAVVLLEIAALPVGAAVGSVVGTIQGTPKAEIEEAERVLAKAFSEMDFQASIRQLVLEAGRSNTRRTFMTADERARGTADAGQPGSVLEVTVLSAGLAGSGEKGAPLAVFLRVQVRLLKPIKEPPLYKNIWVQLSGARPFKEWAADDGRGFREELSVAGRAVAESIVEEIFLAYRPGKS